VNKKMILSAVLFGMISNLCAMNPLSISFSVDTLVKKPILPVDSTELVEPSRFSEQSRFNGRDQFRGQGLRDGGNQLEYIKVNSILTLSLLEGYQQHKSIETDITLVFELLRDDCILRAFSCDDNDLNSSLEGHKKLLDLKKEFEATPFLSQLTDSEGSPKSAVLVEITIKNDLEEAKHIGRIVSADIDTLLSIPKLELESEVVEEDSQTRFTKSTETNEGQKVEFVGSSNRVWSIGLPCLGIVSVLAIIACYFRFKK
jgi:hypothetical protein